MEQCHFLLSSVVGSWVLPVVLKEEKADGAPALPRVGKGSRCESKPCAAAALVGTEVERRSIWAVEDWQHYQKQNQGRCVAAGPKPKWFITGDAQHMLFCWGRLLQISWFMCWDAFSCARRVLVYQVWGQDAAVQGGVGAGVNGQHVSSDQMQPRHLCPVPGGGVCVPCLGQEIYVCIPWLFCRLWRLLYIHLRIWQRTHCWARCISEKRKLSGSLLSYSHFGRSQCRIPPGGLEIGCYLLPSGTYFLDTYFPGVLDSCETYERAGPFLSCSHRCADVSTPQQVPQVVELH